MLKTLFTTLLTSVLAMNVPAGELRIGVIGCDTSHVTAFTELLNNPNSKDHVPGGRVVAAFRGGSPDIPSSANRVEGYSRELREKYGVRFYDTIEEMCAHVDAVLLESVDGRPHWEQARPVLLARKPLFVDKPMAASLEDVLKIFELAARQKTPVFSASALRFDAQTLQARGGTVGTVTNAVTTSPCETEPHHPELFWYGVHGVESLFTIMGTGCEKARRETTAEGKVRVSGTWTGGRTGTFVESKEYGGKVDGTKGSMAAGGFSGYAPLVRAIMTFFQTGRPPVEPAETIEIFAFMAASEKSRQNGGSPVSVSETLKEAREKLAAQLR